MLDLQTSGLAQFLRRMALPRIVDSDAALLARYAAERDEAAFADLVHRHGPMVLGVCRRVLRGTDAEDAFQATFLVLARRAADITRPEKLAAWLYGVAYRTAIKARTIMARRPASELPVEQASAPAAEMDEWRAILDEELSRLPERFRLPVLLCYLQGRTNAEAAQLLGCPKGTIASRLATAREKLRRRLVRRGVTLSATGLAALLQTAPAVPAALAQPVVQAAANPALAGAVSARVTALADQAARALVIGKAKVVSVLICFILMAAGATVWLAGRHEADSAPMPVALVQAPGAFFDEKEKREPDPRTDLDRAIDDGLTFLARTQARDGSWPTPAAQGHVGVTSLAGLAFLADAAVPGKGGRGETVERAIRFILASEDGKTPGLFADRSGHTMYGQGFAVLFLAEAARRMPASNLKKDVTAALERGVALILGAQNMAGGWRYQPVPRDADLSVTCTEITALLAARDAGIKVPQKALDRAAAFVVSCQDANGGFRYMPVGGAGNAARTAQAVAALRGSGKAHAAAIKKAHDHLKELGIDKITASAPAVSRVYTQYQLAQALWDGDVGAEWFKSAKSQLLAPGVHVRDHWEDVALGPHYATAVALIVLQMPKENLFRFRRAEPAK